jgi:hypothetical protein
VVFYGKQIMRENGLDDPADLVVEGNWTIDAMMTMGEVVTRDLDGNGKMTIADAWGFLDNSGALRHLAEGVGHTITRVDSDGVPYLNCLTPEYLDAVEKIYNRVICSDATMETSNATQVVIMKEERGLFYYELLGCINEFRDMESDFSLLPLPKLDANQEQYVTPVNSVWGTALAVPITVADTARVGTVLNVLSAFSVETVNRTLYELILGSKLIREEMSLVMLDYVWANKTYCWGNGYSWASPIDSVFSAQYSAKSFIMASQLEKQTKVINKSFEKFLGQFDELP